MIHLKLLLHFTITATLLSLFGGCAYRNINPEAALEDVRSHNGYYDLREIEPDSAKIVMRAAGSSFPAHFSTSTAPQACQEFAPLGEVAYTGRGIVYPWIANATQRGRRSEPYRVHDAKPGQAIQVRGYGSWADGVGAGYRTGNCGPLVARFTPEAGHGYTVDFVWGDKPACSLIVMDATNPEAPVPVPAQMLEGCTAPKLR